MPSMFSARLTHHRKQLGVSQTELGRRLGVDNSTICTWELGTRAPGVRQLAAIAAVLGVTIAELFLPVPTTGG